MLDLFIVTQMLPLLHAPICIYSEEGELLQSLEDVGERSLIEPEEIQRAAWRYPAPEAKAQPEAGSGGKAQQEETWLEKEKTIFPFPYIHVEENGVTYCLMRLETEGQLLGLGKLRIYDFADEEAYRFPYCGKKEFGAIVCILWKMVSGKEIGIGRLWSENVDIGSSIREQVTKDIFELQEEGRYHKPYMQELREYDSIRRGDVEALQRSIDEVYSGSAGILANDMVRQYKNVAICVINGASRSAIEGGLNPELAFSMSDTFIRNIEENLSEPVKIEKAAREAEFEFARAVRGLRKKKDDNPLTDQVRDYVFCHIHEPIKVRDIAEYVGVTPNYLSEQFSRSMGITLKQYIIDEKLASSEQLLKYTDYSLQEISVFCAFSSQSRFSVYFQRKNGITPARYRKRYQKRENE